MGRLLQVRVSVFTVYPDKVEDAWPELSRLAYPPGHDYAPAKRGVLELIDTLRAVVDAGGAPERLRPGVGKAVGEAAALSEALGEWKVQDARALTEKIEDTLDELESAAGYK